MTDDMGLPPTSEIRARAESMPAVATVLDALGRGSPLPVFLVGGAVRDLLLGREPLDLDLAIYGQVAELVTGLRGTPELHDRFGTATVTRDGVRYDLARTRAERYPHPGALPEVEQAAIDDDLARRDFTVNAIALGLTGPRAGELVAVDGALEDLGARRLEVLHDESFRDDPTRLLRLARYAARLGFEIATHTRALAAAAVADGVLATVSGARIGNELRLLGQESDPVGAFTELHALGLDQAVDRSLSFAPERQALARDALQHLPPDGSRAVLVLGVSLLGSDALSAARLLDRLDFSATDRVAIVDVATRATSLANALRSADTGSAIAGAIGSLGVATVALAAAQGPLAQARRWLTTLRHQTLQITGDDLIANGIPEGPELGRRLAAARDAMWDGAATDRESQLAVALAAR
jgi:tRNA nucleotidyltransferase (CCA-adding enzyme)